MQDHANGPASTLFSEFDPARPGEAQPSSTPPDCCPAEPTGDSRATLSYPPAPRQAIGPYEVLAELKQGGMGVVYHVRDTRLGREVALKMIRNGTAVPEELERFQREARAIAQLKHPHIIGLYDIGMVEGRPYFTMELARGGSLADQRVRFQSDRRRAMVLLAKVARAVDHVHQAGRLHRDLKPANILLNEHGEPLVSDFGLTKMVGPDTDPDLTRTGAAIGTPTYMAPEQAAGQANCYGPPTDVWALGVIAYELLCGSRPFVNTVARPVTEALQHDPPFPPRKVRPDLDRDLETIVLKCLEKSPARRYATAAALADDLEAWLAGEPIRARPVGRVRRTLRWCRRHPRTLQALGLAAVLLAAAAVVRPWRDPEQALHDIEAQLQRGEPVTLVNEAGTVAWSRELAPCTVLSRPGDKEFSVSAERWGLLLLVPDPKVLHYRLEAEVRLDSWPKGNAGVFCCYSRHESQRGLLHGFIAPTLDFPLPKQDPKPMLSLVHFAPEARDGAWRSGNGGSRPVERSATAWYHLAVEASPKSIRLSVDAQEIAVLSEAQRLAVANNLLIGRPDFKGVVHPVFWPGGGLGLFVTQGSASFRHMRLIPDPAQPAPN